MWANELVWASQMGHPRFRVVPANRVTFEPSLAGLTPLEAFTRVMQRIAARGFLIVVDNHQTVTSTYAAAPGSGDENALWFNDITGFTEAQWLADWRVVAMRAAAFPEVIGYEPRNEVRSDSWTPGGAPNPLNWCWGAPDGGIGADGGPSLHARFDWRYASGHAIATIQPLVRPNAIWFIEALEWGQDLRGPYYCAPWLPDGGVPQNVAYSVHVYGCYTYGLLPDGGSAPVHQLDAVAQRDAYGSFFGYVIDQSWRGAAPVWVSEYGIRRELAVTDSFRTHFVQLCDYLERGSFDHAVFTLTRLYPTDEGRRVNADCMNTARLSTVPWEYERECSTYGFNDTSFTALENDWRLTAMQPLLQ
jgi:hypothetical protein